MHKHINWGFYWHRWDCRYIHTYILTYIYTYIYKYIRAWSAGIPVGLHTMHSAASTEKLSDSKTTVCTQFNCQGREMNPRLPTYIQIHTCIHTVNTYLAYIHTHTWIKYENCKEGTYSSVLRWNTVWTRWQTLRWPRRCSCTYPAWLSAETVHIYIHTYIHTYIDT